MIQNLCWYELRNASKRCLKNFQRKIPFSSVPVRGLNSRGNTHVRRKAIHAAWIYTWYVRIHIQRHQKKSSLENSYQHYWCTTPLPSDEQTTCTRIFLSQTNNYLTSFYYPLAIAQNHKKCVEKIHCSHPITLFSHVLSHGTIQPCPFQAEQVPTVLIQSHLSLITSSWRPQHLMKTEIVMTAHPNREGRNWSVLHATIGQRFNDSMILKARMIMAIAWLSC
jgi:hypothetical protein